MKKHTEDGKPAGSRRQMETRTALLRAAERLFAVRGVDAVSMREIAAAAGQANHSAALYHFTDKSELLNMLLERHSDPIQKGWLTVLDHLRSEGRDSLEELVGLMVRSLVAKLDDPDGGTDYLLIVADLVSSRSFPITSMPAVSAPGILELSAAMMRHIEEAPPTLLQLRMMRVAAVLYCSIANYHMLASAGMKIPREEFIADLTDSLVAVIAARRGRTRAMTGGTTAEAALSAPSSKGVGSGKRPATASRGRKGDRDNPPAQ